MRIRSDYTALFAGIILGAGAAGIRPETAHSLLSAMLPQQAPALTAPATAAAQAAAAPHAAAAQDGRWGAESVELRILRRAEDSLFADEPNPEPASMPLAAPTEACEAPNANDWQVSRDMHASAGPNWPSGLKMPSMPVRQNPRVAKYIRYFSSSAEGRKLFTTWLRRSGRYRSPITRALEEHDMPRDLLSIVFVESGFWPTAVSSAGAVGLWQFMPQTAKAYGLKVERGYDERQSVFQATSAAVDHLSDLYARFQSWDLALAAYNLGYASLSDRLHQYGVDDFWSLAQIPDALPKETALYVPKVLAVAVLLNNLDYFGFGDVELAPSIDAAQLEVPSGIRLSMVARAAGTSARALRELNPQIHGDVMPDRGEPLTIYVPGNGLARARRMLPALLSRQENTELDRQVSPDFDWGHDEVDTGGMTRLERTNPRRNRNHVDQQRPFWETMTDEDGDSDSRRHAATSPSRNDDAQPAPKEKRDETERAPVDDRQPSWRIRAEDPPQKPLGSNTVSPLGEPEAEKIRGALGLNKSEASSGQRVVEYRVMRGDNLTDLAATFSTTPKQVARDNRLRNPSHIMKGQILKLRVPAAPTATSARTDKQPPPAATEG